MQNYVGPEGPSVCAQSFTSVDFKGRFSLGSGGVRLGGGGGVKGLCPACSAVPLGGERPRGCATEVVVHLDIEGQISTVITLSSTTTLTPSQVTHVAFLIQEANALPSSTHSSHGNCSWDFVKGFGVWNGHISGFGSSHGNSYKDLGQSHHADVVIW